jgi:cytochrome c-type biogenesis protein CcmE
MPSKALRILASVVVIVGALGFFMAQSLSENLSYYMHVDEVMVDPEPWYHTNMKMHGYVVPGSIERRPGTMDWRFDVKNGAHVVRATYTGSVPDGFVDDAEVVLDGQLSEAGFHVEPGGVMAKCPSKYEEKVGASGVSGMSGGPDVP